MYPELDEDEKESSETLLQRDPEHNELKFLLEDKPCLGISCVRFGELVVLIERIVYLINKHIQYVPKSELRRLQSDLSVFGVLIWDRNLGSQEFSTVRVFNNEIDYFWGDFFFKRILIILFCKKSIK